MIDFDVPEPWIELIRNSSLKQACDKLRVMSQLGVEVYGEDGSKSRVPRAVGITSPRIFLTVDSKKPIGKTRKDTRYRCGTSGNLFKTKAECKAGCPKPKPPKKPSRLSWDFLGSRVPDCSAETTLEARYRVLRTYKVLILRFIFQWDPDVGRMPSSKGIVDRWNKTIRDHEKEHVEQVKQVAEAMLVDEAEYTARGADEFDLAAELDRQIMEDNQRILDMFRKKMKADAAKYHTRIGATIALPTLCK